MPIDPWHFRRVENQRKKMRKNDIYLKGLVPCPGSFMDGMKPHCLKLFTRPRKKTSGNVKPFATCDHCGLWINFWGDGWTNNDAEGKPIFSLNEKQTAELIVELELVVMRLKEMWRQ